jgi:dTDP-4-amino-4,6-dideoxygalactose transaminase
MGSSATSESSPDAIPFNDLGRATQAMRAGIDAAIARVVDSGWYVLGPEHAAFESELAAYVGADRAVLLGNGTDALELALSAVGVVEGDAVVTVANAGGYTTIASRLLGAVPVYCDVDPETLQATPETVREALERAPRPPRAIVVTHLYGAMADVEGIAAIAREQGIAVIEDCAQALGARRSGRMAGTFGDIATASFYPTKNLGALGDGGAVVTGSPELADRVVRMRQYGWEGKYRIEHPHGRNSRMDELQAAILRAKLPALDVSNVRRRAIHALYERAAGDAVRFVSRSSDSFTGHLAVIQVDDRTAVQAHLLERGIRTDVHYPIPDHRQPLIAESGPQPSLPATEAATERILSLPLFPELTALEVDRICAALEELT